jgi:hypothetical protein
MREYSMKFSVKYVKQVWEGYSPASFFYLKSAGNLSFFVLNWSEILSWVGF